MSPTPNGQAHEVALATPEGSAGTRTRRPKAGPIIALSNLGVAMSCTAILLAAHGVNVETLFETIRILTKISFLLFIVVVICRPLHDLVGNSVTAWMLANRRYIGLSFAAWHLMHWPILSGMLVLLGPTKFWEYFGSFAVPAGCVLLVITLLAATSSNRARRFLGKPLWSAIHTIGVYAIWAWFFRVYLLRLPKHDDAYIYVYLGLLVGALAFRWVIAAKRTVKNLRQS